MVRKARNLEGQPPLFIVSPNADPSKNIQTWVDIENDPRAALEALGGDNIGPHIKVTERAERLIQAMNALAHHNMLVGFEVAVNDPKYKDPIWERYLSVTPRIVDNAETKADRLLNEALNHFWHATGFEALRGAGLSKGQVKSRTGKMWRDFTDEVGSPKKHKDLVKLRNTQKKFLPKDHVLRQPKLKKPKQTLERAA